jgi:hypothetical protein
MIKPILIAIFFQIIFRTISFAQDSNSIIIHKPSYDSIEYAIDLDGNQLFELPAHHKFIIDKSREDKGDILFEYVYLYDLNRGPLVVRNGKRFYLIDAKGNKTIDIPEKYAAVKAAWDGLYRVTVRKERTKEANKYNYLNSNGEIAFEGRTFLQAPHFSEGKALIQNLNSSWEIIDINGQSRGKVKAEIGKSIVKAGQFHNNRCLVQTKEDKPEISSRPTGKFYYLNTEGEIIIDANESFGYLNHFNPSIFKNGTAYFQNENQVIFFDTLGLETNIYDNITNVMNREGDYLQLYNTSNQRIIIDRHGRRLEIPQKPSEMITPDKIFGNYLKLYFTDRSTYKRGYKYIDLSDMTTACESNSRVIYVLPNRLITGSKENPNDLYMLKDMKGKVLFKNNLTR